MSRISRPLPAAVARALHQLGGDIRDARRRRRLPMSIVSERALITRVTLTKVERGDPGVGLGTYATVLFVLGLLEPLARLADPGLDSVGLALEGEHLPKRIRLPRPKPRSV